MALRDCTVTNFSKVPDQSHACCSLTKNQPVEWSHILSEKDVAYRFFPPLAIEITKNNELWVCYCIDVCCSLYEGHTDHPRLRRRQLNGSSRRRWRWTDPEFCRSHQALLTASALATPCRSIRTSLTARTVSAWTAPPQLLGQSMALKLREKGKQSPC